MNMDRSRELFEKARAVMVGGVNSPVRAFKSVGGDPVFMTSASGSKLCDVDGNEYIDYVGSWGPMILGHAHPQVLSELLEAARRGTSFGTPCEAEIKLAEKVVEMVPSVQKVRMVNSGTEATMSALRLARGWTGRSKVVKFEGCYHGHGDSYLIKAGSGATTFGVPDSAGVTEGVASDTLNARFNDLESVRGIVRVNPEQIAAIILEPVAGNMGVVGPAKGFLEGLRALCDAEGIVLVFDEVMSGFRVAPGGAQELYGVLPDLTTMGKVIGGGLPVGAYGGRAEIMEKLSPEGPVYQAGTLSGNPLAMTAGYETLCMLSGDVYAELEKKSAFLEKEFIGNAERTGVPVTINRVGSMMTLFFTERGVVDYETAKAGDASRFAAYFRRMLSEGIYLPPSQFEALFVSFAHSTMELTATSRANLGSLEKLAEES